MENYPWQKIIKKFNDKGTNHFKRNDDNNKDLSATQSKNTIKIITDEPTLEDALNFERYSSKLAEIIRNSTPRFTIGIFGGWGTRKTSLMKMIEANLHRKGASIFNWERILLFKDDSTNLKNYLQMSLY